MNYNIYIDFTQYIGGKYNKPKSIKNVIDYLKKTKPKKIDIQTMNVIMYNNTYCDKILGEGVYGQVIEPGINDKNIAIKYIKNSKTSTIFNIKNTYYICNGTNIEVILLQLLNDKSVISDKLVQKHLPQLIGYANCTDENINKIITKRYGLDKEIKYKTNYISDMSLMNNAYIDENVYTTLNTFAKLIAFLMSNVDLDTCNVILPNNKNANVIELLDGITISFLYTIDILITAGFYINDLHHNNIFIEWTNNTDEEIIYKIGNNKYKVKTYGINIIFGDVGTYGYKINNNLYIFGRLYDAYLTEETLKLYMNTNYQIRIFFDVYYFLPIIKKQLIMWHISNDDCYDGIYNIYDIRDEKKYMNFRTPVELAEQYCAKYKYN